jgi:hypothetical protein
VCTDNLVINSTVIAVLDQLLPELQNIFSQLLQVKPVGAIPHPIGTICKSPMGSVPIPSEITTQTSDLLIFLTARPDEDSQIIAAAANCFVDAVTSRPTSAHINMNVNRFFSRAYNDKKGTMIHEITHALGFSADLFGTFVNPDTNEPLGATNILKTLPSTYIDSTDTPNTKNITYLKTPRVIQAMKSYFNCSMLPTDEIPGVP